MPRPGGESAASKRLCDAGQVEEYVSETVDTLAAAFLERVAVPGVKGEVKVEAGA